MNKTELVAAIAEKADMSKKDAEKALKAFEEVVTEELTNKSSNVSSLASSFFLNIPIYITKSSKMFYNISCNLVSSATILHQLMH